MQVPSLGQKDSLEEGIANYSSIFTWKIPWTEESMGLQKVGSHWSNLAHTHALPTEPAIGFIRLFFIKKCSPTTSLTTVRTGHGTTNCFQIGKGVCQGCILSPCLFKFYAECIMWNAGLDEAQARIKIYRRNINNKITTNCIFKKYQ